MKIKSIKKHHKAKTYDIHNFANGLSEGNFVIDGLVVHNSILKHGVNNFYDLMILNACGHPGPIDFIPEIIANRDDKNQIWKTKLNDRMLKILNKTYGYLVYQEQLAAMWQSFGGFSSTEAQNARKAVAKKWGEQLKAVKSKWIEGATKTIGESEALRWWDMMSGFARYAFNASHSVSYCLVAYRTLWLKAHFAPEYWAAVMSSCHPDKLERYIQTARNEGWVPTDITKLGRYKNDDKLDLGIVNINNLTNKYTVTGSVINQGLIGVKGIGEVAAQKFAGKGDYKTLDEFVADDKKDKKVLERFIKLGAFKHIPKHGHSKALWNYYQYKYTSYEHAKEVKKKLLLLDGWTDDKISQKSKELIAEYKSIYPKRNKIPNKLANFKPEPDESFDKLMRVFEEEEDYTLEELLNFEKEFLGYYIHSPMDVYQHNSLSIRSAIEICEHEKAADIEVIITEITSAKTKSETSYMRLNVFDGVESATVFIWEKEMNSNLKISTALAVGNCVRMMVKYDEKRNSFSLLRNEVIIRVPKRR